MYGYSDTWVIGVFIAILIGVAAFFIGRVILLWYVKINKRVELLEEQNRILLKILDKMN